MRDTINPSTDSGQAQCSMRMACGAYRGTSSSSDAQPGFTGVNVDRIGRGRIVEHGGAANMLEPLLEAGALRPVSDGA